MATFLKQDRPAEASKEQGGTLLSIGLSIDLSIGLTIVVNMQSLSCTVAYYCTG